MKPKYMYDAADEAMDKLYVQYQPEKPKSNKKLTLTATLRERMKAKK